MFLSVYFMYGKEKQKKAVVAGEAAFISGHQRTKWDIFLEWHLQRFFQFRFTARLFQVCCRTKPQV
jgi:hypothetical protein